MKKLALALVCLVSVAFFASCDPKVENPEPAIQILATEGYLQDGQVADVNVEYSFGFVVSSNAETQQELASLVVTVDDEEFETVELTGNTFTYESAIEWVIERDIIDESVIKAVVTDVDGKVNTATITVSLNQEPALEAAPFTWFRLGTQEQSGLEEFGLIWDGNAKVTHAQIKPMTGVTLLFFEAADWDNTVTATDKANLFQAALEQPSSVKPVYNNVSTTASGTYNDVIGTITTDGEYHLINVRECTIGQFQAAGYPITITGNAK